MPKGIPNKRYTPEFKIKVVETMRKEKLSYCEAAREFDVCDHHRVADQERIYLEEGKETNIVYLVLDADENSKGAAHWAVEKPNIINVAATRAREEFYIIGDKKLYKSLKAETIERTLKVIERFSETE